MGPQALTLRRRDGWPARFADLLAKRRALPFAWGTNDCLTFAVDVVEAITGTTICTVDWDDAPSAARKIAAAGSLADVCLTPRLGPPGTDWRQLRRGDVAIAEIEGRDTILVCSGQTLCGPGLEGLEHVPPTIARLVWRVG